MAIKQKCIICGNCRQLVVGAAYGKCDACGNKFTGKEVGVPITMKLRMEGLRPGSNEIEKLKNTLIQRKRLPSEKKNNAVMSIVAGIVVPIILVVFGLWTINTLMGVGKIIVGYGSFVAAPILALLLIVEWGIKPLAKAPKKETIEDVFLWIWKKSYAPALWEDDTPIGEHIYKRAFDRVKRIVPSTISEGISEDLLREYLSEIRSSLKTILDKASDGIDTACKFKDGSDVLHTWESDYTLELDSIRLKRENETEKGVCEVTGSFVIKKDLFFTVNEETCTLKVASMLVDIHSYYIKSEDYWFPYDPMPRIIK
ncbi:MAG: hypothetical protein GX905_10645 [Bacteroidales bacterium]|nr:hypothetical protein [Bacteroidales bacterium]